MVAVVQAQINAIVWAMVAVQELLIQEVQAQDYTQVAQERAHQDKEVQDLVEEEDKLQQELRLFMEYQAVMAVMA
jgi:cell division protein FtsB